jgi:hypothetical protein
MSSKNDTDQSVQGVIYPRAVGYVRGVVAFDDESQKTGTLTLESGHSLPCSIAIKQAVAHLRPEENQILKVFPQSYQDACLKLKIAAVITKEGQKLNHFHIVGTIRKVFEDSVIMPGWSARKRRRFKIQVFGKLDNASENTKNPEKEDLYELSCRLEGTHLVLVESRKLAENMAPATTAIETKRQGSLDSLESDALARGHAMMEMSL